MEMPIILLFMETIRNSGPGVTFEQIIYFHYNGVFFNFRDIGYFFDDGDYSLLPTLGEVIYFEDFKEIYDEHKMNHKIDEELVDSLIREHQLKNLLDS